MIDTPRIIQTTEQLPPLIRGGYEGLVTAGGELDAWIKSDGHAPAPDLWECYVAGRSRASTRRPGARCSPGR